MVFVALTYALIKLGEWLNWLFSFKWWIYLLFFLFIIGIIVLVFFLKYKYSKRKNLSNIQKEKLKELKTTEHDVFIESNLNVNYYKDFCPRCGGKIVKRHGPFGDFYGCSNYSATKCTYTRKFK